MPSYTFKCTWCSEEQDIITKYVKVGDKIHEKCCKCENKILERINSNKGSIGFKGLSTPGHN